MKSDKSDIALMLPVEYIDALLEVIDTGIQRAKINPAIRHELIAWWQAERNLIKEEIDNNE